MGSVQSSAVTVTAVEVEVLAGRVDSEGAESTFFRRSGRSAGMSVAVYLRTRGLSARARSPVPALFVDVGLKIYECTMGGTFVGDMQCIRTRVRERALDGAFRSGIR